MKIPVSCDIFCTVVDNYGDIGVCWRLARQLAHEHGVEVRLWVDDLGSFHKLCPEVDVASARQHCRNIEIRHWTELFPDVEPAQLVIEAFACKIPESYVAAMAARVSKPVWINLEYLCAEDWVESCHQLPSPHPSLPLVKYFFFPGFTPKTGGLLLECGVPAQRDAFLNSAAHQEAFWQSLGLKIPDADTLKISLFSYENSALHELFNMWVRGPQSVLCLVPEGRIQLQVEQYFKQSNRNGYIQGKLEVRILPFVEQERYDKLLWACDINFVRGEDSCVRAQWAGKPFVWHIYPQHDGVHLQKLRAFMQLYCTGMRPDSALALHGLWEFWNDNQGSGQNWNNFYKHYPILLRHAHDWAQKISANNLSLNLLDFFNSIDRMRDSEILV